MQLSAVLREFRGSAHLMAVRASGLDAETAHFIRRPEMYKTFGYDEATPPAVTDADKTRLAAADALTDKIVLPAFSAVDSAGADALAAGAAAMDAALKG